jgi:hypothetical protein
MLKVGINVCKVPLADINTLPTGLHRLGTLESVAYTNGAVIDFYFVRALALAKGVRQNSARRTQPSWCARLSSYPAKPIVVYAPSTGSAEAPQ